MNFMEAVSTALRNYKNLSGRASRSEFWYWYAFIVIVNLLTSIPVIYTAMMVSNYVFVLPFATAELAIAIFLIMPTIAAAARRLHDTDKSGWYMLIFLIPLIGGIMMIVMLAQPSQPGSNRFGV
jgi:uncharacterized membrane protein YhaH (DUF805 family)